MKLSDANPIVVLIIAVTVIIVLMIIFSPGPDDYKIVYKISEENKEKAAELVAELWTGKIKGYGPQANKTEIMEMVRETYGNPVRIKVRDE